jgi:myo-inositol-1(or 4)-monophosphatase
MEKIAEKEIVEAALLMAYKFLPTFENSEKVIREGKEFGDLEDDTVIRADIQIGGLILGFLRGIGIDLKAIIKTEEGDEIIGKHPKYLITLDPLDGSLNWQKRRRLPYTATMAVFSLLNPKFSDCHTAGTIDLRNGTLWIAGKGEGCFVDGKRCYTNGVEEIGKGNIIIAEFYYPDNREIIVEAFRDFRGYLRNSGSAAYELTLVADGAADAFICRTQKNHELGPAYRLIKEAGGTVIDWEGKDLGSRNYEFSVQTPVIAAATPELAQEILERVQKVLRKDKI